MKIKLNPFEELFKVVKGYRETPGAGNQLLQNAAKAGSYLPGSKLFQSLGESLAARQSQRMQEETTKRQIELEKAKQAQIKADKKLRPTPQVDTGITQATIKDTPTTGQIIASGGELAILAAMGYKPGLTGAGGKLLAGQKGKQVLTFTKQLNEANKALKLKNAAPLVKFSSKYITPALREGAIGAGFFGLSEKATNKEATPKDIASNAALGAVVGAGTTLGATALGSVLSKTKNAVGPLIGKGIDAIERTATTEPTILKGGTQMEKIAASLGEQPKTLKQKTAQVAMSVIETGRNLKANWVDRYSPLQRIQTKLEGLLGRPLKDTEKVYRDARLLDSISDARAEQLAGGLINKLQPYQKNIENYKYYLTNLDYIDRAKLGQKVPTGQSLDELEAGLQEIRATLGEKGIQEAESVRQIVSDYNQTLLQARVDAGLISKETAEFLKQQHPNYIPHNVLLELDDRALGMTGDSLNVAKTDIMRAVGSTRNIQDPIEATILRTPIATKLIEKNNLLKNLAVIQENWNAIPGMKPLQTAVQVMQKNKYIGQLSELTTQVNTLLKDKRAISKYTSTQLSKLREIQSKLQKIADDTISQLKNIGEDEAAGLIGNLSIEEKLRAGYEEGGSALATAEKGATQLMKSLNLKGKLSVAETEINNLVSKITDLNKTKKDLFFEIQALAKEKAKLGEQTINFFRNGIKETWVVPKDIAIAVKNLDAPLNSALINVVSYPAKILKNLSTRFSLSFSLPNKFRDLQTAALTSNAFIESLAQKTGVNPRLLNLSKEEILNLYKQSGGYGASIFREGESKVLQNIKALEKGGVMKMVDNLNPVKLIENINDQIEISTRLEVFKNALSRGLLPKDAALVSRDATIDFARMGNSMKQLNQVIPFLNARLQGFLNLPKAFVAQPEVFARLQLYTAVYPTLALQNYNRQFSSYKNISDYIKNKYWVLMVGQTEGIDENTGDKITIPQFLTIPKGEGQGLVSGPIQYYLDKADGIDYRSVSQMLADTIGNASPLSFQSFNQGNPWLSAISQLGPLATIPAGLGTNKVPFTGQNIVPESRIKGPEYLKFSKQTPEFLKAFTKSMNDIGIKLSPANIAFVMSSFGSVAQDLQKGLDMIYNKATGKDKLQNSLSDTTFGDISQMPLASRFAREANPFYSPEMEYRKEQKQELNIGVEEERLTQKDETEKLFKEFNLLKTKEEKLSFLKELKETNPQAILDIAKLKTYKNTVEVLSKTDSVNLRASYIFERMNEMKAKNENVKEFLQELVKEKILTKDVMIELLRLKKESK